MAFSWTQGPIPARRHAEIVQRISEALANEVTQDAVRRATGDRKRILHRVKAMVVALETAQIEVNFPAVLNEED
jgi:hypothetical protein